MPRALTAILHDLQFYTMDAIQISARKNPKQSEQCLIRLGIFTLHTEGLLNLFDRRWIVTELVALFSALLKTYPTLMKSLTECSSADLTHLILQTHDELSRGKPVRTPDSFFSCVKKDVPEEDWRWAVHCTRTWGPASSLDPDPTEDAEVERMTMELLWMSAMITELQQRNPETSQSSEMIFDVPGRVH